MGIGVVIAPSDYAIAKSLGFDHVELSGRNIAAMGECEFRALCKMIDAQTPCLGLNAYCPPTVRIAGPGFDIGAASEYAQRLAPRAKALGAQVVGIGSPFSRDLPADYDRVRAWDEAAQFFKETAAVFAPYNIDVCVEALGPCYCNFINLTDEAIALAKAADEPNLQVVLDFYNMEHSGEAALELAPRMGSVRHVHMSDDDGDPKKRWFFRADKLDAHRARLHKLRELGYQGHVTIEIDLPIEARAAQMSLDALKRRNVI